MDGLSFYTIDGAKSIDGGAFTNPWSVSTDQNNPMTFRFQFVQTQTEDMR